MASKRDRGTPPFIARDELDELFGGANLNPDRIDCPPRRVLAKLARRRASIDDGVYEHLQACSRCYRDFLAIGQGASATPTARQRRRRVRRLLSMAAVVALAVGAGWIYTRWQPPNLGGSAQTPSQQAVAQQEVLDLRPYSASRSFGEPQNLAPADLPAQMIVLRVQLPTGSAPGRYDLEIRGSSSQLIASASGEATIVDFVTTLAVRLDLRQAPSGPASLRLRRAGEDWSSYRLVVTP